MTVPTHVDTNQGFTTGGGGTVLWPAGLAAGDVIIAAIRKPNGRDSSLSPGTWTPIGELTASGSIYQVDYYWYRADGTESGSVTWAVTGASGGTRSLIMSAFRSVIAAGTPYEALGSNAPASTATKNDVGVITLGIDRLAVNHLHRPTNQSIGSFTGETGGNWTAIVNTGAGSPAHFWTVQTASMAAADTIDGGSITVATADAHVNRSLALIGVSNAGVRRSYASIIG